jgi:hypothetical protein
MFRDRLSPTEKAGRLFKLLGWGSLVIAIFVCYLALPIFPGDPDVDPPEMTGDMWIIAGILLLQSVVCLFVGNALKRDKQWAKIAGAVTAAVMVISQNAIHTVIGIALLYYLFRARKQGVEPGSD